MQEYHSLDIRPYQLLCLVCRQGCRSEAAAYCHASRLNENGPCMVCPPCNAYHASSNQCIGGSGMGLRDDKKDLDTLRRLGLRYGDVLSARELLQRLYHTIHSTTDGLLHIVGLYFSVDVYDALRGPVEAPKLLRISSTATLLFGTTVTVIAAYVSTNPILLIILIGASACGGMASTLFAPLFLGMFWRAATRAGALASSLGGMIFALCAFTLRRMELISLHEIYPGVIASLVLMVAVSATTRRSSESTLARFFSA